MTSLYARRLLLCSVAPSAEGVRGGHAFPRIGGDVVSASIFMHCAAPLEQLLAARRYAYHATASVHRFVELQKEQSDHH